MSPHQSDSIGLSWASASWTKWITRIAESVDLRNSVWFSILVFFHSLFNVVVATRCVVCHTFMASNDFFESFGGFPRASGVVEAESE